MRTSAERRRTAAVLGSGGLWVHAFHAKKFHLDNFGNEGKLGIRR
ncbi:hypothetical protein ACWD00_39110 [Streptomyces viridiviolaceus]